MRLQKQLLIVLFSLLAIYKINAQDVPLQSLDSVVITSSRIDLPFKENSRTITIISSEKIKQSAATNVADLLQEIAGVDIRRRGTNGMQSDLYIRGGGFDQTLLLIDGMKMEDAQTGHHSMNMALPLEVIDRIEIIKGPASRVFGQNAFTGAINIVTKTSEEKTLNLGIQGGSYSQLNGMVTASETIKNTSHLLHYSKNTSDGYRYNTDYNNSNYFLKSNFNKNHNPITFLGTFQERKFGANGFYASPSATDQYEETQTSLISLVSNIKSEKLNLKPKLYWRRNQDIYVFVRHDPSIYRNLHITNKIGAELNASLRSKLGVTGLGIDLSQTYLSSNNLGDRERFMATFFVEHQLHLVNNKLDITPGIAMTYFSDFKFHAFPGMDIGYTLNKSLRLYGNIGYTYRIPTYTDLYYSDPTTLGNPNLDPEEAIAEEFGLKYHTDRFWASLTFFNRDASKLIDYVKDNEEDLWQAVNIRDVNTKGMELNGNYYFKAFKFYQIIEASYSYIDDDVKALDINFSRYSINSLKHQAGLTVRTKFLKNFNQTIVYKYAERTSGEAYNVFDASINATFGKLGFSFIANNIFNADYYETNLVPMPKGNVLFGMNYQF